MHVRLMLDITDVQMMLYRPIDGTLFLVFALYCNQQIDPNCLVLCSLSITQIDYQPRTVEYQGFHSVVVSNSLLEKWGMFPEKKI